MAIPAEQGLVKHYKVSFGAGTVDSKKVTYTIEGGVRNVDLSPQLQGQGIAVFIENPSDVDMYVDIYTKIRVYGEEYRVRINNFTAWANSNGGYALGYGLLKKDVEIQVTTASAPVADADVIIAIVPSNG